MTGTINKMTILGHLGADPEIRVTQDGREIARLSVATNERYTDKDGVKQERTEWHRVVIFPEGLITKVVKPYLREGSRIFCEGTSRTDKYTDKEGVERFSTDIILQELTLLDGKPTAEELH